jgi:hypothetical protein
VAVHPTGTMLLVRRRDARGRAGALAGVGGWVGVGCQMFVLTAAVKREQSMLQHSTLFSCRQVGFSDKLRLMAVLMDDLKTVKELPIRGCRWGVVSHRWGVGGWGMRSLNVGMAAG